jgi:hypothetical protein
MKSLTTFVFRCSLPAILAVFVTPLCAQTWTGGGTDGSWATADNWNPSGAPASANTTDLIFTGNVRTTNTHAAYTLRSLTFDSNAAAFELAATGSLTFGATASSITQNSAANQVMRGSISIASGNTLTIGGTGAGSLTMGNATGTSSGGSNLSGGGIVTVNRAATFIFNNSSTTSTGGVKLGTLNVNEDFTLIAGASTYNDAGTSFSVTNTNIAAGKTLEFQFVDSVSLTGTNRIGMAGTFNGAGKVVFKGDLDLSRTEINSPRITTDTNVVGPTGGIETQGNILLGRGGGNTTATWNASINVASGTTYFGSADTMTDRILAFGGASNDTITIQNGAKGVFDNTLGSTGNVASKTLRINAKVSILAGGVAQFRNSATITSATDTEIEDNFIGSGTTAAEALLQMDLGAPVSGNGGISYTTAAGGVVVVNGTGIGGLRVQGTAANLGHLFSAARMASTTGTGGYLTPAATDTTFVLSTGSQWADADVGLRVTNSYAGGTDVSLGANSTWNRAVFIDSGAALDADGDTLGGLVGGLGGIAGTTTLGATATLNPGASPGTLTFANDLTLTSGLVYNWEYGAGLDLVSVLGTLTLASNVTINVIDLGGGSLPETPVLFSAGALAGSTDLSGWTINGLSGYSAQIQGNNVVLAVPEPGIAALLALGALGLASRRRRPL